MTARLFNQKHAEQPVSRQYTTSLIAKFEETVSLQTKNLTVSVMSEMTRLLLVLWMDNRKISQVLFVSRIMITGFSLNHKCLPYKLKVFQEINGDDYSFAKILLAVSPMTGYFTSLC